MNGEWGEWCPPANMVIAVQIMVLKSNATRKNMFYFSQFKRRVEAGNKKASECSHRDMITTSHCRLIGHEHGRAWMHSQGTPANGVSTLRCKYYNITVSFNLQIQKSDLKMASRQAAGNWAAGKLGVVGSSPWSLYKWILCIVYDGLLPALPMHPYFVCRMASRHVSNG